MGLSPQETDNCTLWEFAVLADGWKRAHGTEAPLALEDETLAVMGIVGFS